MSRAVIYETFGSPEVLELREVPEPRAGPGLDRRSREQRAAALDLLAGQNAQAFITAAATLAGQGDLTLALEIIAPGLLRHPDSRELAELRQAVLVRLIEQRQLLDPFGLVVYAQQAGAELSPVR